MFKPAFPQTNHRNAILHLFIAKEAINTELGLFEDICFRFRPDTLISEQIFLKSYLHISVFYSQRQIVPFLNAFMVFFIYQILTKPAVLFKTAVNDRIQRQFAVV